MNWDKGKKERTSFLGVAFGAVCPPRRLAIVDSNNDGAAFLTAGGGGFFRDDVVGVFGPVPVPVDVLRLSGVPTFEPVFRLVLLNFIMEGIGFFSFSFFTW